ncbi:MAG: hypothetical protein U0835_12925 [Isosphaeraceae bacterium]
MDPDIRKMVGRLDSQFGKLSGQVDEIRDGVRQVMAIAEADPEMALTKSRKVLESVLRQVWAHYIPGEPIGTRPLEFVIQRLQKDGFLPGSGRRSRSP